jgi:tetratricopeptide (TPR) repeat protein
LSGKGFYHFANDHSEKAVLFYRKALEFDDSNPLILYNLGSISLKLHSHDDALAYFNLAIQLDGKDLKAYNGKARTLYAMGRFEEACEVFAHLLSKDPLNSETQFNLSQCYLQIGRIGDAKGILEDILSTHPHNHHARSNLGVCLLSEGEIERAIDEFEVIVKADSSFVQAYYNLSIAYSRLGKIEESKKYLEMGRRYSSNKTPVSKNILTRGSDSVK